MEAQELTKEQQLEVVESMIATSRKRLRGVMASNTLLWGYMLLVASLAVFVVTYCMHNAKGHFIWYAMVGVGIPLSILLNRRKMKEAVTHSRVDQIVTALWIWVSAAAALSALHMRWAPLSVAMVLAVGFGASGSILRLKEVSWIALPLALLSMLYLYLPVEWVGLEFAVLGALPMIVLGHWLKRGL